MRKFVATLFALASLSLAVFAGTAQAKYPYSYHVDNWCQVWQSGQWGQSPNGTWHECIYVGTRSFTGFGWVPLYDL